LSKLLVSLIIPTYNRAGLIGRAIDSAIKQLIPGDEIIVVDDGSTDNTEQVLSAFRDKIRYFKIPNSGVGAARNFGIRNSGNPLVAFLDSDDEWESGKLELQRAFMQKRPDVLCCFTDFAVTFKDGSLARNFLKNWHNDPRPWDEILSPGEYFSNICPLPDGIEDFKFYVGDLYPSLLKNPYVPSCTPIVRREAAGESLYFAEDLNWGEDWVCYANLARKGPMAYLDRETAWQHGDAGGRLTDTSMLDGITTRIKIMERVWGSDDNFQKKHGQIYRSLIRKQRHLKVRELIALGYTGKARSELRLVDSPHKGLKILAAMPGPVVRILMAARRSLRSRFRTR